MPKKKNPEKPEDQAKRFRALVQKLIDAGELNPTEADEALDWMVKRAGSSTAAEIVIKRGGRRTG